MNCRIRIGEQASRIERTGAEILAEVLFPESPSPGPIGTGSLQDGDIILGTPRSSSLIAARASEWRLAELGAEGFLVQTLDDNARSMVIAAGSPRGVLYGCATAAERLRLGEPIERIRLREKPVLEDRNLWVWGGIERNPRVFFDVDRMRHADSEPRFRAMGRFLAQARVNALTLWPNHDRPDMGPRREEVIDGFRKLTRLLREDYGVECYLFMWYEIKQGTPTPINGWPICPFNEQVIRYWNERIDRVVSDLPDIRGIVMAGAGGDWVRGPWECQCAECRRHTDQQLLVKAMEMIGRRWSEAGGRIIWKAVTDRPTLVGSEVEHFANIDEALPPYVKIAHKAFYKDFRPVSPLHPIFFAHADRETGPHHDNTVDSSPRRPYFCEFQIFGEYRGLGALPCVMVDRWGEIAPLLTRKHYSGSLGICSFRDIDPWDHPLNMANWYAWGRYAWNPDARPDDIYRDWARLTFGEEAADAVIEVCRLSYQASTRMMFFRGVMTQNHSKLPTIDYELESSLIGPWHDIPKAPDGFMGRGHDVSMYPREAAEQIRNDPALLLWAHRVPITPEICDEAIAEKREALEIMERMGHLWSAIPHAKWESLHCDVSERLARNRVDAELWYECHRLYFDYKAGRLTRSDLSSRLADIKRRFDPRNGSALIHETFDRFIEEWQRVLDGNLTRRSMEGLCHNPAGEPFLPGLKSE